MFQIEICHNTEFQWDIITRNSYIASDLPSDQGGEDEGPTPEELFLAAIGSSCAMQITRFLNENELSDITDFKVIVTAGTEEAPVRLGNIRVSLVIPPGFPEEHKENLILESEKNPIMSTLLLAPSVVIEEFAEY